MVIIITVCRVDYKYDVPFIELNSRGRTFGAVQCRNLGHVFAFSNVTKLLNMFLKY